MCNHYSSSGKWRDQMGEFSQLRLPVFDTDRPRPNVQGPDIWPAYTGEILRVEEDKLIAEAATWLFVPFWMKKPFAEWRKTNGGCNNAKGETAETSGVFKHAAKVGRCLIPGEAFYEYAKDRGADGKKPEYRFSYPDDRPMWFAGLRSHCDLPDKGPMATYTMVTKPQGAETASIGHLRQPVNLQGDQLSAWLDHVSSVSLFLEPSPAGTFKVELARGMPGTVGAAALA